MSVPFPDVYVTVHGSVCPSLLPGPRSRHLAAYRDAAARRRCDSRETGMSKGLVTKKGRVA